MLRGFFTAIILASTGLASADVPVKLPPGTRAEGDHQVSGRGLRDTTDFLAKELDAKGIVADKLGPYSVHGVELSRFVSHSPSTPWLAIHVIRQAGKTLIFFVPRSGS
jgi:hypothetical protein